MLKNRNFKAEDVQLSTFENTQVFIWRTRYDICDFAYCLNQLYGIHLSREIDYDFQNIKGTDLKCPNYLYYDEKKQLFYILVDNSVMGNSIVPELDDFDKVMFIYGRDSKEQCKMMYEEFNGHVDTQGDWDILGNEHRELMSRVIENGIIDVEYICFVDRKHYQTSVTSFEKTNLSSKAEKRIATFIDELEIFLDGLERKISMEEVQAKQDETSPTIPPEKWILD